VDNKLFISELRNIRKELKKKFKHIENSDEKKPTIDLQTIEIILKKKDLINNYLKYIKEIYGGTKEKSSRALIKKILEIIKKI
jgi:hypothetical protein